MDPLNLYLGFTNVCRLCLGQDRPLMKIFPETGEEKGELFSIASKILACIGIQVLAEDNLPDKICEICLKELDHWTEFKQICDNSNTLLLQSVAGLSPLQNQILRNNLRECHEENLDNLMTPSVFDERLALEAESFFQKIDEKHLPSLLSADSLSSVFVDGDNVDQNETITLYGGEAENSEVITQACGKKVVIENGCTLTNGMNLELKDGLIAKEPEVGIEDIMVVTEPDINMEYIIDELEQPALFGQLNNPSKSIGIDINEDVLRESNNNEEHLRGQVDDLSLSFLDRREIPEQNLTEISCSELNKQNSEEFGGIRFSEEFCFPEGALVGELCDGTKENIEESLSDIQKEKYKEKYHKLYKNKYDCGFCPRVFSKFFKLLRHDKTEHADVIMDDKCQICGTCFISEGRLLIHSLLRHRERPFQCVHCNFTSASKKSLTYHIQYTHIKEFALGACHICGKFYRSKSNLINHIKLHKSSKHPCDICGREFSQPQSLNRHYNTYHNKDKSFECDICLKRFTSLSYVQIHKNRHHSNPTVCDICGLHYKNEVTLNIHKKTHEEKTHCCSICSKSFTTKNLLNRHMNIHSGSRVYICKICDKYFKRHDILKAHLFTHADVQKPFKCDICNQTFRLKRYLTTHSNNIHKC